jgi:N-acetyl-anhydromuramyl-L-alanine amidase AmpD
MIDDKTYQLPENNYYKKIYTKTQIVIGHNGRKDMRHYEGWVNRRNGVYKSTANFTIDKDGTIYKHFDPKYYSDFVGVDQDKGNISILLVNEGWLKNDSINNVYIDWLGHTYSKSRSVLERTWRGHHFWMNYRNPQMKSLKELVTQLCEEHNIEKECIGHCVYNEDVDIFNGVAFRSNYDSDITDISPAFDMDILKEL